MSADLEFVVTARDEASAKLRKVDETVAQMSRNVRASAGDVTAAQDAFGGLTRASGDLERGLVHAGHGVARLAEPLAQGLSPALGQVSGQMSGMLRVAASMGLGIGALEIAAVGLSGVLGGQLLEAWRKNKEAAVEFGRAMSSMDLGRITEQSNKARLALEVLRDEMAALNAQVAKERLGTASPGFAERRGFQATLDAARRTPLQLRQQLKYDEFIGSQENAADIQGLADSQVKKNERIQLEVSQRSLYDFRLQAINRDMLVLERQAQDIAAGTGGRLGPDPVGAARLRQSTAALRRFRYAGEILGPQTTYDVAPFEGFEGGLLTGPTQTEKFAGILRREAEEIEKLRQDMEQAMQHPLSGAGLEQIGIGPTDIQVKQGQVNRIADEIELRQLAADRASIMQKMTGLTADQREAMQLQIIAAERLLAIDQAKGNAEKKDLADLRAEVETVALLREHLERTDIVAGLGKAAREMGDEWAAAGLRAEETFKGVAGTIQQTLASVLRGDKMGKDFGKQFADSIRTTVTDELSKFLVGSAIGSLRQLLLGGGGGPFSGSVLGGAVNAYAGGGGGGGGGLSLSDILSLGGTALSALGLLPANSILPDGYSILGSTQINGQNYSLLSRSGNNFNAPTTGIVDLAADYGFQAANYLGLTTYASLLAYQQAQGVVQGSAAYYGNASVSGSISASLPALGSGVGYEGLGAAVARLGFGAYEVANLRGGYSTGETALLALHEIGQSSADLYSFGLAELGPLLGNWIGGDFGRFLQYGGFSFVRPSIPRRVREAISVRDVLVPFSNEFITRINGATTPEELFAILVSGGSGYTGGTTRLAIRTWVNGKIIGTDLGVYPGAGYATVDDLLNAPETLIVQTNYGVSQHFLDSVNAAVAAAIKAKVAQLNAILAQGTIGYIEPLAGGGVTRSTVEPLGTDVNRLRGLDLFTQTRKDLATFFNDDNLAESFLRRLVEVDRNRDLGILTTENFPI